MQTVIVVYGLRVPLVNGGAVTRLLRGYENWAMLTNGAYLLLTEKSVEQVRDDIGRLLNEGDVIYVGTAPAPSAWSGLSEEVSNWILGSQK